MLAFSLFNQLLPNRVLHSSSSLRRTGAANSFAKPSPGGVAHRQPKNACGAFNIPVPDRGDIIIAKRFPSSARFDKVSPLPYHACPRHAAINIPVRVDPSVRAKEIYDAANPSVGALHVHRSCSAGSARWLSVVVRVEPSPEKFGVRRGPFLFPAYVPATSFILCS